MNCNQSVIGNFGTSILIAINICKNIMWKTCSTITHRTELELEYEEAIILHYSMEY